MCMLVATGVWRPGVRESSVENADGERDAPSRQLKMPNTSEDASTGQIIVRADSNRGSLMCLKNWAGVNGDPELVYLN